MRLTVFSNGASLYVRRPRLELGIVPLGGDRAVQLRQRRLGRSGTQESNLAIPLYQSGPFNQLGRARGAEGGGVEPRGLMTARAFKARCRAGGAPSIDFSEESG